MVLAFVVIVTVDSRLLNFFIRVVLGPCVLILAIDPEPLSSLRCCRIAPAVVVEWP